MQVPVKWMGSRLLQLTAVEPACLTVARYSFIRFKTVLFRESREYVLEVSEIDLSQ